MARRRHGWLWPTLVLLGALALSVLPLPDAVAPARPDWVAIALLYSTLIEPRRYGLLSAFWLGLALDTLSGSLLGQHALALLLVVYLSQRFYLRTRVFPASQLALYGVLLLALYEFVLFWVDGVADRTVPLAERWAPVLSGGMVWTLIVTMLDRGRQQAAARM